jgi:tail tube GTA-gp10-like protein
MANPWAGEVALELGGERKVLKLNLGALAELETWLQAEGIADLVERFEEGGFKSRDVLALVCAGLRGGGWDGDLRDLAKAEITGGPLEAARVAARLLALAFRPPQ